MFEYINVSVTSVLCFSTYLLAVNFAMGRSRGCDLVDVPVPGRRGMWRSS